MKHKKLVFLLTGLTVAGFSKYALSSTPANVTDLTAQTASQYPDQVDLTWTAPDNGAGAKYGKYLLKYSTAGKIDTEQKFTQATTYYQSLNWTPGDPGQPESKVLTGLLYETTFWFSIKASSYSIAGDSWTWSTISDTGTASCFVNIPPSSVTEISAVPGINGSEIVLNWTAPGDDGTEGTAASYDIRYSTDPSKSPAVSTTAFSNASSVSEFSPIPSPSAALSNESMTITGLMEDTTYYFAIRAADEVGNTGGLSAGATTWAKNEAPAAVTDLEASTGDQITLKWTMPGDNGWCGNIKNGKFRIQHSTNPLEEWNVDYYDVEITTDMTPGTTIDYSLGALEPNATYYIRMWTADSEMNWSGLSNAATAYAGRFYVVWSATHTMINGLWSCLGDFDGDGDTDFLAAGAGSDGNRTKLYSYEGNDNFKILNDLNIELSFARAGDYDNDGDLDFLVNGRVCENDGSSTFTISWNTSDLNTSCGGDWGDYDNDGDLDILFANLDVGPPPAGLPTYVYENKGNDNFELSWQTENTLSFDADFADVNNDGGSHPNIVYINNGDKTFTNTWQTSETADLSLLSSAGDYNNDGNIDFSVACGHPQVGPGQNRLYSGNGDGTFVLAWTAGDSDYSIGVSVADYDGDGKQDLVFANAGADPEQNGIFAGEKNKIYKNMGGDTFSKTWESKLKEASTKIHLCDYDGDGDLDQFVSSYNKGTPDRIYKNMAA